MSEVVPFTAVTPSPAAPADAVSRGGLPVDPWRLLGGLWKRRYWVLVAGIVGLAAGLGFGLMRCKTRYQVSVQLIKRGLPSSFRVGEIGEAFRPQTLSAGTLVGAAAAPNVLERVSAKSQPKISVAELRGAVEVKDQKNTDFVFLTLSGAKSAQATVDLANLWADEAVDFSRQLQSQESRETRQFLQGQVDVIDADLRKLDQQMFDFSKRENLVDAEKQTDAYLRSLGDLDLKYETARIDLETIDFKIKGAEEELRRQSPLADKLRTAQAELDALRVQYTDQNPAVLSKLDTIKTLEKQLKAAQDGQNVDLATYAGTTLGNTLYLNLVQYQNEKKALSRQKEEFEKLREQARARLEAVPEKAAAFGQLKLRKQSLETARTLLSSRLREAQLFEENSPGYYSVLAPATLADVHSRSKVVMMVAFTLAGMVVFLGGGIAAALGAELLDPQLRTGGEAARAFHAPLFSQLKGSDKFDASRGLEIWSRWIAADSSGTAQPRIVWSPSPGEEEMQFWNPLFDCAAQLLPRLRVVDCGPGLLKSPNEKIVVENHLVGHFSIDQAQQFGIKLQKACRAGEAVWIRVAGPVHEPLTTLARHCAPPLVLVRLNANATKFWQTQGELLAKTVTKAAGVITVNSAPRKK